MRGEEIFRPLIRISFLSFADNGHSRRVSPVFTPKFQPNLIDGAARVSLLLIRGNVTSRSTFSFTLVAQKFVVCKYRRELRRLRNLVKPMELHIARTRAEIIRIRGADSSFARDPRRPNAMRSRISRVSFRKVSFPLNKTRG